MNKKFNVLKIANSELDRRLLSELINIGIIQNQSDFGRLFGKDPSYFACMSKKENGLAIGSLAFLIVYLIYKSRKEKDPTIRLQLNEAIKIVHEIVQEKVRIREISYFA